MKKMSRRFGYKKLILLAMFLVLTVVSTYAQSGMGVYTEIGLGFGQFGADFEYQTPAYSGGEPSYSSVPLYMRTNAFALTPVVGITPFRGHSDPLMDKLAFEFQLAMQFGQKYNSGSVEVSSTEIRPGVLAKFNLSIADWARLTGNNSNSSAWTEKLITYAGVGFGIPIRTGELSYSDTFKSTYSYLDAEFKDSKATKVAFQIITEVGMGFQINDKFSLNWTMASLGFIGHSTYAMTFGAAYHFK